MPDSIGQYKIVSQIGRGGMGTVYKAHDPLVNRFVAVKVISPDVEVSDELRARFFREAQSCGQLSHPSIVTIYQMGEVDGRLFIAMEFLEGIEIKAIIKEKRSIPLQDKVSIMIQVCEGLHYAHRKGVV